MATEKLKVYEENAKKRLPIWAWLLPLIALLLLALWFVTRHTREATTTGAVASPAVDQTKPDASAPQTASAWTAATIADSIRSKGIVSFTENDVHFGTASANLAGDSQAVLDQTAQALKDNPEWRMRVVGHTDSVGSDSANAVLSQQRALSVVAYLTAHGVGPGRLSVEAKGATQPVANNDTDTGRAENRRVDLIKQ
ncbi:MAG: OmpA family protein [Bryobacteraceae bacterium]